MDEKKVSVKKANAFSAISYLSGVLDAMSGSEELPEAAHQSIKMLRDYISDGEHWFVRWQEHGEPSPTHDLDTTYPLPRRGSPLGPYTRSEFSLDGSIPGEPDRKLVTLPDEEQQELPFGERKEPTVKDVLAAVRSIGRKEGRLSNSVTRVIMLVTEVFAQRGFSLVEGERLPATFFDSIPDVKLLQVPNFGRFSLRLLREAVGQVKAGR